MIRKASSEDIPAIMAVYDKARSFMRSYGNDVQWTGGYPQPEVIEDDIAKGSLYVIDDVAGVFFFAVMDDPTYHEIDGSWSSDRPYGVIHRIASAGSHGILDKAIDFAFSRIDYLRIDTHEKNIVMNRALSARGFRRCGIIHIADGTPRIAYDRERK